MPIPLRTYRKKISSLKSSRKITKAMELISAVKMRKAAANAAKSEDYSEKINNLVNELNGISIESIYLTPPQSAKKQLVIAIGSNRGLCGNFNYSIFESAAQLEQESKQNDVVNDYIIIGKRVGQYIRSLSDNILSLYDSLPEQITFDSISAITGQISSLFLTGEYQSVILVYSFPHSALKREVIKKEILPFKRDLVNGEENEELIEKILEPEPTILFNSIIERLLEAQIFFALLKSKQSEHSARMIAMKSAGDSAKSMSEQLTIDSNKVRQAEITQRISEVSNAASVIDN